MPWLPAECARNKKKKKSTAKNKTAESKFSSNYPTCCGMTDITAGTQLTENYRKIFCLSNQLIKIATFIFANYQEQFHRTHMQIYFSWFSNWSLRLNLLNLLSKFSILFAVSGAEVVNKKQSTLSSKDFLSYQEVAINDHHH